MLDADAPMIKQQLSYLLSQLWVFNHETGQVEHPESFNAWLAQAQDGRNIAKTKMNDAYVKDDSMLPGSNRTIDLLMQLFRIIMVVYLSPVLLVIISIAMVGILFEGVGGIARRAHAWHL